MNQLQALFDRLNQHLSQIVVGQPNLIRDLLVALLSDGHTILEGVPGTGKTLLVNGMARLIQADFRRIQLTPDVLPSDILGTSIFDLNSRQFSLRKGPIFTQILLADEINRTPPKTQSALLEAMEEQQVTLDGNSMALPNPFWVIATQNSLEFEGTYPLPEAQLDRFMFKLLVDYPDPQSEKQMLLSSQTRSRVKRVDLERVEPVMSAHQVLQARQSVKEITTNEAIVDYVLALVQETRQHQDLSLGASPRAGVAWLNASRAHAWLSGREFATADDVKATAMPLLRHRLILRPETQLEGVRVEAVIEGLLNKVAVPR